MKNVGSAILILGCLFFGYAYGFDWWLILLILLATLSWVYYFRTSDESKLIKTKIDFIKAKTDYYVALAEYYARKDK